MKKKEFKAKSEDAQLPRTRKQLLSVIVKDDFVLIADGGLLSGLFSLPLIALWAIAGIVLVNSGRSDHAFITSIVFYNGLIALPLIAIRYLARGGIFELFKRRAFNEGYFVSDVFFSSIKQNFGRYLAVGLVVGLSLWLSGYGITLLIGAPIGAVGRGIGIGGCLIFAAVIYCSGDVCLAQNGIYDLGVIAMFRNGLSFVLMRFLPAIAYFLATVVLPLALCGISLVVTTIVLLVYVTFIDGFSVALSTLYCHSLFDKYINAENYPTLVGRGLFKDEE